MKFTDWLWVEVGVSILGIALSITDVNEWFVAPAFCTYVCAVVFLATWITSLVSAHRMQQKISEDSDLG